MLTQDDKTTTQNKVTIGAACSGQVDQALNRRLASWILLAVL